MNVALFPGSFQMILGLYAFLLPLLLLNPQCCGPRSHSGTLGGEPTRQRSARGSGHW